MNGKSGFEVLPAGRSTRRRASLFASSAIAASALLAIVTFADTPGMAASPVTIAALPVASTSGRGATLPFVEYEAETAQTNGTLIGPDRTFTSLAAEASGRKAIKLAGSGRYVAFTLASPANAVTVRYAIPDSASGTGINATLGVYVGSDHVGDLATTSRYGWFYGANPFTNKPADGKPHHFFDEARLRFTRTLPAGTVVKLMIDKSDTAPWYAIDLADFELVPAAKPQPAGSLSVAAFGADPTGTRSSALAFTAAIAAGRLQQRTIWIPAGIYRIDQHLYVDRVTIAGAGPWYSVLRGTGVGIYGNYPPTPSKAVVLQDFAIIGEVTERNDQAPLSGIGGAMGGGSKITNLWIQHQKTGIWFDGPLDGVTISDMRILDTTADGVNFHKGVSHAIVQNSFLRNTGDDALAMWSQTSADHDNSFTHNTIVEPILANGIGIYGGHDITVANNVVADTLTEGGGIHIGNRFSSVPVSGAITVADNTVVRGGGFAPGWVTGIGALWLYALDSAMSANVQVSGLTVIDSSADAIQLKGKAVNGVTVANSTASGTAAHLLLIQAPGNAAFTKVTGTKLSAGGVSGCRTDFALKDGGGNTSWLNSTCK